MDSKERRSSPRHPLKLNAELFFDDGPSLPCHIQDFCAEGVFIRFRSGLTPEIRERVHDRGDRLGVRFREASTSSSHKLHVKAVRLIEGAMGVTFEETSPGAVDAMMAISQAEHGTASPRLRPASDKVQYVLHQCARTVVEYIEPLMANCLTAMIEDLKNAAQSALSDQEANSMMDASGQVEARKSAIWLQMKRGLESPLKPNREEVAGSELSLVDKGEFEDWLMLRVMVTRADTLHRAQLLPLRMRLDQLGVTNETGNQNPLGPALVCDAFHAGLQNLNIDRSIEKVCLKALERTVLKELGPLYEELNGILQRQGILPDLDLTRYISKTQTRERPSQSSQGGESKGPSPARPSPKPETAATPQPEAASATGSGFSGDMTGAVAPGDFASHTAMAQTAFATVRNLLSTLSVRGDGGAVTAPPADAPVLSHSQLQQRLHELQVAAASGTGVGATGGGLGDRVREGLAAEGDEVLDESQQEALDVVDRFFSSVVDSPRLSEVARGQFRQIQLPVLRVVMQDPAFFEDTASPVRGVMNRLAQLGEKNARVGPVVQRKVDELIQRITTEFDQDTAVFESVQDELDSLIDRQNLVYRRNVERVMAAAEGAQKVTESKKAVREALESRIPDGQVPHALNTLLEGGWRDLLSLTWIRQGPESPVWQDYLQVVDSLMAFAVDPDSPINLPELLRTIQEGLASISSNQMPSASIREVLKGFLTGRDPAAREWVTYRDESGPEREEPPKPPPQSKHWLERARGLSRGDWLEDYRSPDTPQSIRLVWIADNADRFVFVNHQGMRVSEMSLNELARELESGTMVIDEEHDRPFVDESIDRMVKQVYDQLSWVSTHDDVTGLLIRREFERTLEQHLARGEEAMSLVQLELRGLRLLTDTAGYQAGDEVLKQVVPLLRKCLGEERPLARFDGPVFAWLDESERAEANARSIIQALEALSPTREGRQYQLSACAGIARPTGALLTADRWLRAVAQAGREAMEAGGGRISTYQPDPSAEARQEEIAARLAELSPNNGHPLQLRCQKIIPLHGQTAMGTQYEVLVGMYDDAGELITGAELVRVAERYDRMQAVDRWVVGQVLAWLRRGSGLSGDNTGVCINLSGHSLNDAGLLEFIYETLSKADVPIERLWFELTEAAAIRNVNEVVSFMGEMRELGCRFCLGQMGSGPASYEFMRNLPVDMVRLDPVFVRAVDGSDTDRAMVRSMVEMAHYSGREVIAGQIEKRAVIQTLTQLGVDYGQGYAIEKPGLLDGLLS